MNPLKLQIIIDAQNKTDAVMKDVSSQFSKLNGQIDKLQPAFGAMAAAGTAAFAGVASIVGISIGNYVEAERSVRQLEHAVIDVSKGNREQVDSILAITDALQKKSGIDGDALTMGAAQLSTFGLQTQSVLDLTKSLADLTVNQNGVTAGADQYVASANTIAKALNGQFGILEKSGIRFTEAQQNLILYGSETEKVAALTEGLNQNLRETTDTIGGTAEGTMAIFKQSLGDISETIGAAFLPMLQQVIDKVIPVVQQISTWAAENPKLVIAVLAGVAAIGLIIGVIGTLGLLIPAIITGVQMLGVALGALGTIFAIVTSPIGLIIAAIIAVIAVGVLLVKHWDEVKAFTLTVWEAIKNAISKAINGALAIIKAVGQIMADMFWFYINFMIGAVTLFLDFFLPGWQGAFNAVWNTTVTVFEAIKAAVSAALTFLLNSVIIPVLNSIKAVWDFIWGAISGAFGTLWEAIKGAAGGALSWIKSQIDNLTGPLNALIALAEKAINLAKSVGSGIGKAVSGVASSGRSVTGRAIGGPVGTNVPHLVGERGPELFWPNGAGRIVANGAMGGSGIVINISGNDFMGREGIAEQIGNDILRVLKQNMKL